MTQAPLFGPYGGAAADAIGRFADYGVHHRQTG